MLKRLLDLFRSPKRDLTPEDLAALDEAERIHQQKVALWVGRHEGPPSFTGNEESRRGS
jgi:hypothetical protein